MEADLLGAVAAGQGRGDSSVPTVETERIRFRMNEFLAVELAGLSAELDAKCLGGGGTKDLLKQDSLKVTSGIVF